jgi:hypothetical protein
VEVGPVTIDAAFAVAIGLPSALAALCDDSVLARVEADLAVLADRLGVPRRPAVVSSPDAADEIRLSIDGHPCGVPSLTVAHAWAYTQGTHLAPPEAIGALLDGREVGPAELAEVLSLICQAAVSSEAGLLLPGSALRPLLDLGLSLTDVQDRDRIGPLEPKAVEELASRCAGSAIDLFIDPAYLQVLTSDLDRRDLVPEMRAGLFAELGLPLPPFRLRLDTTLRPGAFAFGIHAVRTVPLVGLPPGKILVNDTAAGLSLMGVEAQATTNPVTGQPAGVVSAGEQGRLLGAGLTTWEPFEYLVLAMTGAIRRRAACLLTSDVTNRLIEQLGTAFPVLVELGSAVPSEAVTSVLRDLLTDRVSIRNLPRILECLVRYEMDDEARRQGDRESFVRSRLRDVVGQRATNSANMLVVYLVDPALEERFRAVPHDGGQEVDGDAVVAARAALRAEVANLSPTALTPAVLTQDDLREALRAALRPQFPDLLVLGYRDIPPEMNIKPVSRVSTS